MAESKGKTGVTDLASEEQAEAITAALAPIVGAFHCPHGGSIHIGGYRALISRLAASFLHREHNRTAMGDSRLIAPATSRGAASALTRDPTNAAI